MWTKLAVIGSVVSTVILLLVIHFTEPATIGPLGILFVFVLIYITLNGVFTLLVRVISFIFSKMPRLFGAKTAQLSDKKAYYYGSILAAAPVLLIGMQSINKLGIYDVFLVALFVGIVCFYIAKRTD